MTHRSDIDGNIDITLLQPGSFTGCHSSIICCHQAPGPRNTEHWSGAECRPGDLETKTLAFVRANYEPSTQKYSRSIVQYQQQEYSKM